MKRRNPTNLLTRRATLAPSTFNAEKRTLEVIWSTGAGVQRRDAQGIYTEILDLSRADLSQFIGASVLDAHAQHSLRNVIGVVVSAEVRNGQGIATIQLSSRADVADIISDIAAGVIRHVSIGYAVRQWAEGRDSKGNRTRTAIAWAPRELSFVPVPADPGAVVRSNGNMDPELEDVLADNQPTQTRAQINTAIRSLATQHQLSDEWANAQIDAESTVEAARSAALESIASRAVNIRTASNSPANDDPGVILERRVEALHCAVTGAKPSDAARQFVYEGLADHARAFLIMRGVSVTGLSRESILERAAHGTSDFPQLLTGVGNRVLLESYQAASSPLKTVMRQASARDFRPMSRLRLSGVGRLEEISEQGEVQGTTRGESIESYSVKTFARMFSLSRKAIINDDLGAFRDWSKAAGEAAALTEADEIFALLTQSAGAGPLMEDGERLFSAAHANIDSSGDAIAINSLSDARKALRTLTDLDGVTLISVTPKFLIVGPENETTAEKILAQIEAAKSADVNPFAGKLTLLVEPRIEDFSWYIFGDPAQAPVLEWAYLSGAPGPQMATREGFETLGQEFRVVLDFGVGAIGHRGAFRNAGAAPDSDE